MIKKNFNDFTLEIKKQLIGERRAKKGKDLEPYYTNIAFAERDNGGVIVLSEFKLIFESGSSGFGSLSVTSYIYNTNEIIVTALNKDGTLDWSNVIPKEQKGYRFRSRSFNIWWSKLRWSICFCVCIFSSCSNI